MGITTGNEREVKHEELNEIMLDLQILLQNDLVKSDVKTDSLEARVENLEKMLRTSVEMQNKSLILINRFLAVMNSR